MRRENKESARLTEVKEQAEADRLEQQRRFDEAGLRDEDLRRRESELTARHEGLDSREAELQRREAEWREREGPSVADVVTGRAEGSVHDGTASWTDEGTGTAASAPTSRTAPTSRDGSRLTDGTGRGTDGRRRDVTTERRTNA